MHFTIVWLIWLIGWPFKCLPTVGIIYIIPMRILENFLNQYSDIVRHAFPSTVPPVCLFNKLWFLALSLACLRHINDSVKQVV